MSKYDEHVLYAKLRGLDFEGYGVPTHTMHSLENYYYHKLEPGSFMTAVLSGYEDGYILGLADHLNRDALEEIKRFIQEQLPEESFGSRENVKSWIKGRYED